MLNLRKPFSSFGTSKSLYRFISQRAHLLKDEPNERKATMSARTCTVIALAMSLLSVARTAAAHCDSMDGPVVKAAQRALAAGEVAHALIWVKPEHAAEIREAFSKTLRVRNLGREAAELADRWFFETLVRVHREGEGEPYTGLKPAGYYSDAAYTAADQALATRSFQPLGKIVEQVTVQ